jgi:hypothetical protein
MTMEEAVAFALENGIASDKAVRYDIVGFSLTIQK